ncbi:MAG: DUF6427 family protein [Bacteroidota bacterium]|nr:DUF6427 family protein [Bacteroidota bacterium]
MVFIFKSQRAMVVAVLAILAFIVKGMYILEPNAIDVKTNNYFGDAFMQMFANTPLKAQYIIATLIILLQAIFINWIVKKFELLEKFSWLPALSFVLMTAALPQTNQLSPQLIANFFVLAAIWKLFVIYKSEYANKHIFELGFICSLATLFRFELIYLLPLILYALGVLRVPNLREMLLTLLGFITPIYILTSCLYIFKTHNFAIDLLTRNFYKLNDLNWGNYYTWIPLGLLVLMYLAGAIIMQENIHKSMLKIRKMLRIIIILFPVTIAIAFIDYENLQYDLIYMMAPTSILVANYLLQPRWYWVKEFLITVLIAAEIYLPLMLKYNIEF